MLSVTAYTSEGRVMRKDVRIPIQENHCYLVYYSAGDGDWKAFGVFYVEGHDVGKKVILDQVERIAFWQD